MAMKEAYVKRVIEVFKLKPKDLGTTPQYFCDVFEFCEFLSSTTTTTSTTTFLVMETTSTFAGESLISTISNTTTKASSMPETTAKTTEPTTPTTSVKTTSEIPADRIEIQPSDLKELESKVEASEDKDAEAKALGTETALEKIADNSNPGIVFHGIDESEQEVEASKPKVTASIGSEVDSEPETDGEPGWGSGSSRTSSDFTSKAQLCCLILTLSHALS